MGKKVDPNREKNGRWRKGVSGNPNAGSRSKMARLVDELLDGESDEIARKCIEMAKAGDQHALRICMERICPPRKGRTIEFDLPKIETAEDHPKAVGAVLEAVAAGELTPEEALVFSNIVAEHRRSIEAADHEARINEIAELLKAHGLER